jgi:flagellar basal body P-ring protein FlgI
MNEAEEYITLEEAAAIAPGHRSTNCIWRWCRKGIRSRSGTLVCLRHVRVGRTVFTTARWLVEFGENLAEADSAYFQLSRQARQESKTVRRRSDKQRQAAIEKAQRELAEMGV